MVAVEGGPWLTYSTSSDANQVSSRSSSSKWTLRAKSAVEAPTTRLRWLMGRETQAGPGCASVAKALRERRRHDANMSPNEISLVELMGQFYSLGPATSGACSTLPPESRVEGVYQP
jgi:hypothetical protein